MHGSSVVAIAVIWVLNVIRIHWLPHFWAITAVVAFSCVDNWLTTFCVASAPKPVPPNSWLEISSARSPIMQLTNSWIGVCSAISAAYLSVLPKLSQLMLHKNGISDIFNSLCDHCHQQRRRSSWCSGYLVPGARVQMPALNEIDFQSPWTMISKLQFQQISLPI